MRRFVSLILILLAVSCTDKDKTPSGIIPREKMEKVLWDMIQADQYSALFLAKDSSHINVKAETQKLYQQVFQLHEVSREEFSKSFQYYLERPGKARSMFDSLLAEGNRQRAESYKNPALAPRALPSAPVPSPSIPAQKPLQKPIQKSLQKPVQKPVLNPIMPGKLNRPGIGPHIRNGSTSPKTNPATPSSVPAGEKTNIG
ncbi:DUF4296 domain-containing protein [Flavitalea flava]